MGKIRILIVDDSLFIRQSIGVMFKDDPDVELIGEASNPFEALERIQNLNPDVILLDIQMPKMDGLTFLKNLIKLRPMPVIMFSAYAEEGSENALKAFEYGAVDIIEKPKLKTKDEIIKYRDRLVSALQTAVIANISNISKLTKATHKMPEKTVRKPLPFPEKPNFVITIGASTGGTEAIKWVLQEIPENFPPIVIVQHMPVGFTNSFSKRLDSLSKITVKEAEENDILRNGYAYIARGDMHLTLKNNMKSYELVMDDSEPVNRHKPSVDVLFNSVEKNFKNNAIGVLLTGMGKDGAQGLMNLKKSGAYTIAQDENTCVVYGMPKAAVEMGAAEEVLPIYKITETLINIINKKIKK